MITYFSGRIRRRPPSPVDCRPPSTPAKPLPFRVMPPGRLPVVHRLPTRPFPASESVSASAYVVVVVPLPKYRCPSPFHAPPPPPEYRDILFTSRIKAQPETCSILPTNAGYRAPRPLRSAPIAPRPSFVRTYYGLFAIRVRLIVYSATYFYIPF